MVIKVLEERIPCFRAEKGPHTIRAFDENGICIYEADRVSDLSLFTLEDGQWSEPEVTESQRIEELETLVAQLLFGDPVTGGEAE